MASVNKEMDISWVPGWVGFSSQPPVMLRPPSLGWQRMFMLGTSACWSRGISAFILVDWLGPCRNGEQKQGLQKLLLGMDATESKRAVQTFPPLVRCGREGNHLFDSGRFFSFPAESALSLERMLLNPRTAPA